MEKTVILVGNDINVVMNALAQRPLAEVLNTFNAIAAQLNVAPAAPEAPAPEAE